MKIQAANLRRSVDEARWQRLCSIARELLTLKGELRIP
jgi:hypothetical protein